MQRSIEKKRFLCHSIAAGLLAVTLYGHTGAAQAQTAPVTKPFLTLNGQAPLVIGHRGLPGLMPEETLPSYDMAAAMGTDAFEEDLHLTKDCILVARHNPWLSDNTNIAEVAKIQSDGRGAQAHRPGPQRQGRLGRLPRQRSRRLSDRPHRPQRSEIGPEVADRRRRGPYRRLVDHRFHLGRIEGMARRHDLRCRQASGPRSSTASSRS